MKCERCGSIIMQGSSFCENCGFPVSKMSNNSNNMESTVREGNRNEVNANPQMNPQMNAQMNAQPRVQNNGSIDMQKQTMNNAGQYQQNNNYNYNRQYVPYQSYNNRPNADPSLPGYICMLAGGGLTSLGGIIMFFIDTSNYAQISGYYCSLGLGLFGMGAFFIGHALSKMLKKNK